MILYSILYCQIQPRNFKPVETYSNSEVKESKCSLLTTGALLSFSKFSLLEEGARDVEEEIFTPDDPPDYEPPPEYNDVLKMKYVNENCSRKPNNRRYFLLFTCKCVNFQ